MGYPPSGYPPPGPGWGTPPPGSGWGTPLPTWTWLGYPPACTWLGYPPAGPGQGTPPPGVDRHTDACQNITFPRATYAVGNKSWYHTLLQIQMTKLTILNNGLNRSCKITINFSTELMQQTLTEDPLMDRFQYHGNAAGILARNFNKCRRNVV